MRNHIEEVARKNKNWSLYRLAERLNLPQQTIYSWANTRTQPSFYNMERLCLILDCTLDDLFSIEAQQTPILQPRHPAFKEPY